MEKEMDLESYSFNHLDHDYVADEHEPKDFVGRKTRSYKDLWRKFYTPNFKTIVWQYNPSGVEKSYNFFAPSPLTPNAKSLPVYLRIESKNEDHRILFKGSIPNSFYVPLFALIAMGHEENLVFTQKPMEVPKKALWQELETKFLSRANDWKPMFSGEPPKILAREENGSLVSVQLSNKWEGWQDILPQMGILDTAAKHGGKPVRHLNISLQKPILIRPIKSPVNNIILERFSKSPNEFYQGLIDTIHEASDPDASTSKLKAPYPWKLEIYSVDKAQDYIKTSHDPFNLYETYIYQSDWNNYMSSLQNNGSSIRPFPRITEALFVLSDKILVKVGRSDIAVQASINKKLGRSDSAEKEDLESFKKSHPIYMPRKKLTAKAKELEELKMEKRERGLDALTKVYELGRGTAYLSNDLDVDKIQRAAGKRPDEAGQKEIMGGVSATEIGNAMGWGSKRLRSGVFPAEWLHLSAFSWGGIAGDEDPEGFTTSQNFENLVFGTSETNSLMTRYETAWQRFFLAEKELAGTGKGIIGSLDICCNDFSKPILWDMVTESKHFSTVDITFTKQELELVRENPLGAKRYLDSKPKTETNDGIRQEMLILAHDFPFIVYSIQYDLQAYFHSRIFRSDDMSCSVPFFPFRRPFYHRAEAILDDLVFKEFYGKAKKESDVLKSKI
ncbi:hypothetical protein FOXG_18410 [Fusarium oxysporum f. sp. lycopersici 4287]|uniref:Uncharacterized protein n=1 Tax=Fusarium oxysporum f. sp. lycopersici (strain 4287 / CBS 123668 / FGSC 9935 / NRRL 34936) TaxID=426428 RepID=A0A0J9UJW5_FUSO4|nr:hypothetical protein FOXG_18410 [Fusarium oxysporum f. sp. lycopersici 4287]KNA98455.1 hypothetical protein FOXG_18410 [Fusarium oxysporum f. sp. lycopersici 4287]